jgi:hypothetical protein
MLGSDSSAVALRRVADHHAERLLRVPARSGGGTQPPASAASWGRL